MNLPLLTEAQKFTSTLSDWGSSSHDSRWQDIVWCNRFCGELVSNPDQWVRWRRSFFNHPRLTLLRNSVLGTLSAPALSVSKVNPHVSSIDPIRGLPDTKRTVSYVFNVTRQVLSPDGYQSSMIVVNGAFPGPLIEANWGDWISGRMGAPKINEESGLTVPTDLVAVNNQIEGPSEGTSIHWHGLLQRETPWFDGVPGGEFSQPAFDSLLTLPEGQQCPIAPGTSFKYTFRADTWGTTWYHSHYSAQYTQGLVGPIVIHGPNHVPYDIDLGPVMVTDSAYLPE